MTEKSHKHVLFLTVVLVGASCGLDMDVTGELLFQIMVKTGRERGRAGVKRAETRPPRHEWGGGGSGDGSESDGGNGGGGLNDVTVAPKLECNYQHPNLKHFNALLGNMINELTRVFVRAHQRLRARDGRRGARFQVVSEKTARFFEEISANMMLEYWQYFNSTSQRVPRALDPCRHQPELKRLWRELLEAALQGLHKAAAHSIRKYLEVQQSSDEYRMRMELNDFLANELVAVRVNQLGMLCDHFQLCYSELL